MFPFSCYDIVPFFVLSSYTKDMFIVKLSLCSNVSGKNIHNPAVSTQSPDAVV